MKIVHGSSVDVDNASRTVRNGGVAIVPTETFYALAADPFNEDAVRRIFRIKSRSEGMPLPLIAADISTVKKLVTSPSAVAKRLMDRFWPGSLTIVLQPCTAFSSLLAGPQGKIGVRVPPECVARTLAGLIGGWITATSANRSGDPDPDRIEYIAREVCGSVDMIVDVGPTPGGKPSTVVEPAGEGVRVIREGSVPTKLIMTFLERMSP